MCIYYYIFILESILDFGEFLCLLIWPVTTPEVIQINVLLAGIFDLYPGVCKGVVLEDTCVFVSKAYGQIIIYNMLYIIYKYKNI